MREKGLLDRGSLKMGLLEKRFIRRYGLTTKWACIPLCIDMLAKLADEIPLYGQERYGFEAKCFAWGTVQPTHPTAALAHLKIFALKGGLIWRGLNNGAFKVDR